VSVKCQNLAADRAIGDYWERQFCKLAAGTGRSFTPHQIGRDQSAQAAYRHAGKYHTATLPDITLWTSPGEHHEIKHKDKAGGGTFGLEHYRIDALKWFAEETGQSVYYTIHCYDFVNLPTRLERKECKENNPAHWLTASILDLVERSHNVSSRGRGAESWVNGKRTENIATWYWSSDLFAPLTTLWGQGAVTDKPKPHPRMVLPDNDFGGLF
jgi:hypothetical protein